MTSMRIDGGASAKLWAKRLGKLIEAIENDGGVISLNTETAEVAVLKGDSFFTSEGRDVSDQLEGAE